MMVAAKLMIGVALCLGVAQLPFGFEDLPSDRALMQEFRDTRPVLAQIVNMARQERGVERISTDFVRLTDNVAPSDEVRRGRLSDARWAEYKRLFALARVRNGIGIGEDGVYFYKADRGLAGSGESKGYLWLVRSAREDVRDGSSFDLFTRIDDHWSFEHSGS